MACLLPWYARRIAHPCDGSRSVDTLPPDAYGANDAIYDQQHRGVGTRDEGSTGFLIIFTHRAMTLMVVLNIFFGSLTLKLWSYVTYTRYFYGAEDTDNTALIHLAFIFGGLVMTFLITIYFLIANYKYDASGGNSVPRFIAREKRMKALEARERQRRHAESVGDTTFDNIDPTNQTMEDIQMEHLAAKEGGATSRGDTSGIVPVTGADGIPAPAPTTNDGGGITKLIQVVHPCRGVDYFEDCPRLERSRTFRLITKVIGALWVFEFVATILDFAIFLEITDPSSIGYERTGGVNALFGISMLIGVALSMFPPWYLYQKKMVTCVANYLH